jgi:hypothetical protein
VREPAADKAAWESQQPREQYKRAAEVTATKAPTTKAKIKTNIRASKTNCEKHHKTKWEAEPALFIL